MFNQIFATVCILILSIPASALTLIGEKEILNLSTISGDIPMIHAKVCQRPQVDFTNAPEEKILAYITESKVVCLNSIVSQKRFEQNVAQFVNAIKFQLLTDDVVSYVTEAIEKSVASGKVSKEQLAESGFTFTKIPGVEKLTNFVIRISLKRNGQPVIPTKEFIASSYLDTVKKFEIELPFSQLFMSASSTKVDTATADELAEFKGILGL